MSHGEMVRAGPADSSGPLDQAVVQTVSIPAVFNPAVPDPVVEFLNNPLRSTDLNPSPREVVYEQAVIAPPVESQMVPLPPSFWTGMSGLLGLGFIRAAKRVRKTFL